MMPLRPHAKLRARRRRDSGGAVIFIVAMTLVVLASLGAYAIQAASSEVRTSGFMRQSTQTHYLTEYAILGTADAVYGSKAQLYVQMMLDPSYRDNLPAATTGNTSLGRVGLQCPSLAYVPANASAMSLACKQAGSGELGQSWAPLSATGSSSSTATSSASNSAYPPVVPYNPTAPLVPGSLGPAPIAGDFETEITDPVFRQAPAGYSTQLGLCFVELTVTATGYTLPSNTTAPLVLYTGQTLETARARIQAGPMRLCP